MQKIIATPKSNNLHGQNTLHEAASISSIINIILWYKYKNTLPSTTRECLQTERR